MNTICDENDQIRWRADCTNPKNDMGWLKSEDTARSGDTKEGYGEEDGGVYAKATVATSKPAGKPQLFADGSSIHMISSY